MLLILRSYFATLSEITMKCKNLVVRLLGDAAGGVFVVLIVFHFAKWLTHVPMTADLPCKALG